VDDPRTGSPVSVDVLAAGRKSAVRLVDGAGNDVFAVSLGDGGGSRTGAPTDIRAKSTSSDPRQGDLSSRRSGQPRRSPAIPH